MRFIDMHCDTLEAALLHGGEGTSLLSFPKAMVDFQRMKEADCMAQFFAIWVIPPYGYRRWFQMEPMADKDYIEGCVHIFRDNMKQHADVIAQALCADDIRKNSEKGLMSAVLTLEGSGVVDGSLENIDRLYEAGFRLMTLTWNDKNCFGSPNSKDPAVMAEGLTAFGKEAVSHMQDKGMIVDVSHLSDGGFADVASIAKKPFVASHSNCRALCPHQRNMTDEMIRTLAEHGGVAGINFGPEFLNADVSDPNSTVDRMIAMMQHMKKLGGAEMIAIGSDFDGIGGNREIDNVSEMPKLFDAMEKAGFTADEIEKIAHKNVLRVMQDCM